jgi:hypothetical protein
MKHKIAHIETYEEDGNLVWEASCTCGDYRTAPTEVIVKLKMEDHQIFQKAMGK